MMLFLFVFAGPLALLILYQVIRWRDARRCRCRGCGLLTRRERSILRRMERRDHRRAMRERKRRGLPKTWTSAGMKHARGKVTLDGAYLEHTRAVDPANGWAECFGTEKDGRLRMAAGQVWMDYWAGNIAVEPTSC